MGGKIIEVKTVVYKKLLEKKIALLDEENKTATFSDIIEGLINGI